MKKAHRRRALRLSRVTQPDAHNEASALCTELDTHVDDHCAAVLSSSCSLFCAVLARMYLWQCVRLSARQSQVAVSSKWMNGLSWFSARTLPSVLFYNVFLKFVYLQ